MDFIDQRGYHDFIEKAGQLYHKYAERILLPSDLSYVEEGIRKECSADAVPEQITAVDIGSETIREYCKQIMMANTVFVNGPMGVFEQETSENGSRFIFEALGQTQGFTVIGGGDSIAAAEKYQVKEKIDYICTGGGALIRFLSGEELPVIKALRYSANKFESDKSKAGE